MAYIRAFTTIFIPCHLEIALSGLKALNVLNDLKAVKLALLSRTKLRIETQTMIKSRQVQAEVKYLHSPKAIHFRTISKKNRTAKTKLTIFRMNMSSSLS